MKKVLYISNIEVPYRVRFFNQLSRYCDLTVLYERELSSNRNTAWAKSEAGDFKTKYLKGINIRGENVLSLGILKELFHHYDVIIVGCYNSPTQMLAIVAMRLLGIPYILNLDGEIFLGDKGVKNRLKRFFLSGADKYLVAGEKAGDSLRKAVGDKPVIPYYFSSLSQEEIHAHGKCSGISERSDTILVVGQYYDYKGMDIALEAARLDPALQYKFVGMGSRTELFAETYDIPENVEIIPFLQKEDLEQEYRTCSMLVLPSRQECWGLVINEAASYGTPIVSTWGSGAAVEFLAEEHSRYLATPGDASSLLRCIQRCLNEEAKSDYSQFLLKKSRQYSIERSVKIHAAVI